MVVRTRFLLAALMLGSAPAYAVSPVAVEGSNGMVVSSQHLASAVGASILAAGGNAVDAAVAVGYALAVVDPCCGNIGGGGFMVLHLADGRESFINFRETAPAAATRDMYLDADGKPIRSASLKGYRAVGVPGTVMGLDRALAEYGSLPRAKVMAPAEKLAAEGFVLARGDTDILDKGAADFARDPVAAKIFLRPDGTPFQPGDRLIQRDLAATLARIAAQGPDAFYKGVIPQAVETASKAGNGVLSAADFAHFTATESPPLHCTYRGYGIASAPPPSSGGVTLCEMLNIIEGFDIKAMGFHSAASVHVMVEAMRHAFLDRNSRLGDPAFIDNPLDRLLSKDYAARIRATIPYDKATPSSSLGPGTPPHEAMQTTHYSVVDRAGNAVSVTFTVNGLFGAGVVAPGTGFLLNDEMDDFTVKPGASNMFGLVQGEANVIAPSKRPLSSMAPTIVTQDGRVALVLGSPGGSRISTIVLQVLLNVVDYGMSPGEAVDAPRLHHQWMPDNVLYERFALSPDTLSNLAGMGYKMVEQTPWGAAELIEIGAPAPAEGSVASSGNDSALSGRVRPGLRYGASDDRRAAGGAVGD